MPHFVRGIRMGLTFARHLSGLQRAAASVGESVEGIVACLALMAGLPVSTADVWLGAAVLGVVVVLGAAVVAVVAVLGAAVVAVVVVAVVAAVVVAAVVVVVAAVVVVGEVVGVGGANN